MRAIAVNALCISSLLMLGGCGAIGDSVGELSRVDPHSMAAYPNDLNDPKSRACQMAQMPFDYNSGAIDLDCFAFPEDRQYSTMDGVTVAPAIHSLVANPASAKPAATAAAATGAGANAHDTKPTAPATDVRVVTTTETSQPYTAYALAVADVSNTYYRNRLASILIKQSDDVCSIELGRVVGKQEGWDTGLSIATSAFSGASAIVTGNLAHSILSGVSALANGSRESIDAGIYHNEVMQAVTQAIENQRSSLRKKIVANYSLPQDQWSMDEAIRDINEYHQQCSFYRGLELVVTAVSKTATTTDQSSVVTLTADNAKLALQVEYWRTKAMIDETKDADEKKALSANLTKLETAMVTPVLSTKPSDYTASSTHAPSIDTSTPASGPLTPVPMPSASNGTGSSGSSSTAGTTGSK